MAKKVVKTVSRKSDTDGYYDYDTEVADDNSDAYTPKARAEVPKVDLQTVDPEMEVEDWQVAVAGTLDTPVTGTSMLPSEAEELVAAGEGDTEAPPPEPPTGGEPAP